MKKILTVIFSLTMILGLMWVAGNANALVFTLSSYSVDLHESGPGLIVDSAPVLPFGSSFDLDPGDSVTVDLFDIWTDESWINGDDLAADAITVGLGFLLHELFHKFAAQHFGCHAEFRADDKMLIFGIVIAVLTRFIFMAPGAVWHHGHVTKRQRGLISAAGPFANILLSLVFFAIMMRATNVYIISFAGYGFMINSWMAFFNLIPFGVFDGRKIFNWSKYAFKT